MPKNIYDNRGRKIGEIRDAGEEAVGIALFLYLIWKALPGLLILALIYFLIQGAVWVWNAGTNLVQYGVINEQEAQVRAQATQIAKKNADLITFAQQAIDSKEYYGAAAILGNIIRTEPGNQQARTLLAQIASNVPGGLVTGGYEGTYYPFASGEPVTFLRLGSQAELLNVSSDGRYILLRSSRASFVVDLSDGRKIKVVERDYRLADVFPSPDFSKILIHALGIESYITELHTEKKLLENSCGAFKPQWMSDNRTLTFVNRDSEKVTILDSVTGYCRAVSIPGVTKYDNISVAVAPDDAHLFILAADSYQPIEVFFVSIDDSSIKKVAELPVYYEHYHDQESYRYFLMSPDGSMIYFPKGFMVNTISGNIYQTVPGAVSWIHHLPSKVVLPQPIIVVTPQKGQRGTAFSFDFKGGFPIQKVQFWLGHESGTKPKFRTLRIG